MSTTGQASQPPFTPGRFAGRTAIVTGAGSGIGRATAVRLANEGARVVAADIAADRLEQLTADFPDLDLHPVAGDVATDDGVAAVMAAAGVLGPLMQTMITPVASADQLAATITWLLSDDASNVNGAILPSDGGWSAI